MKERVVILGHNYNSLLGLARALGSEDYEVCVIRTGVSKSRNFLRNAAKMPESKSRYIAHYATASTKKDDQIIDILLHQFAPKTGKGILFPVDDRCAEILDLNLDRLEPFYYLPNVNNQQGGVVRLMDKYYQKQLAKSVGLPVPEGWSVVIEKGKYEIPDDVTFPCFVKAEMPMTNRKLYMRKCDNYDELKDALDHAASYRNCIMLIEEYVEIEKEYGTVGMCNRENVCIPGITEKVLIGHGSQAGVTVIGKIHSSSEFEKVYEKLKNLIAKTNFQGLFDVDLYESKGVIYFNELNVRIGGAGIGTLLAGVELPKMLADSFLDNEKEINYDAIAQEITFVNERPLLSEFSEGFITWKEYKQYTKDTGYRFIYDLNDKEPYYCYSATILLEMMRKIKRKLKVGQ